MSNSHLALITKTTSLIAAGDIVGAESALAELADTDGDNALMVVLDQLAPKDILAVMREYDDSKASVVNLLVTPEQFARAMVLEKQYKDLTHTHLRNMVNAVVFRDDADPVAFLTAIGDLEGGSEALANYFAEKWSRIEALCPHRHLRCGGRLWPDADRRRTAGLGLCAAAHRPGRSGRPRLDADGLAAAL